MKINLMSSTLTFDGIVEDNEWNSITPIPLTMHTPIFGNDATERTDVFIGHDGQYLYLAGRMYHEDISNLQATSLKRDAMEGSSEYFGFILDSFNDKENALAFFTTPVGIRFDATVSNDAQGRMPVNTSWNTFWDVKTRITDDGWEAELRIPFTSLRFQDTGDQVNMGMTIWRSMPGKNENVSFPAVPNNLGNWSLWKPSRSKNIYFENIGVKKPVYLAPYLLAGHNTQHDLNDQETAYDQNSDPLVEVGLDLKYSLSSNLTLDVTVNPDFAQVEADDQQVNLTRFNLFFPEKRLFFQERSSVFDFRLGGPNRLFYSRKIGLDEDLGQVRILGGVRVVGRMGKWDMGFLNMQTASIDTLKSTNYGVFRARRQVFNQFSYVGGMVTNKIDLNGRSQTSAGIDGVFRLSADDYLEVNYAQTTSSDSAANTKKFSINNARARISLQRRRNEGFRYHLVGNTAGDEYNPEMGFEQRENYYQYFGRVGWGWVPSEKKWLQNHTLDMMSYNVRNNDTKAIESAWLGPRWRFQSKQRHSGGLDIRRQQENLTEEFELGDAVVAPGLYTFSVFNAQFNTPGSNLMNLRNRVSIGEFFDGTQLVVGISPSWKVSANFNIGLDYSYNQIQFSERDQEFIAHLIRLRANYSLNTKLSLAAFVQHNSGDHFSFGNIRLRYNPREGNDLFIVWNTGVNSNLQREFPYRPQLDSRTIILKYTYTFVVNK